MDDSLEKEIKHTKGPRIDVPGTGENNVRRVRGQVYFGLDGKVTVQGRFKFSSGGMSVWGSGSYTMTHEEYERLVRPRPKLRL